MNKENIKIGFIGLGNLANTLAKSLSLAGYKIEYAFDTDIMAVKTFQKKINLKTNENQNNIDLFFITVPDDSINEVSNNLLNSLSNLSTKVFIHTSGSKNINELSAISKKGGMVGSFHIMQTFPNKEFICLENNFAAIETNNNHVKTILSDIANNLKMKTVFLKPEQKTLYHLMGVVASNFFVGNLFAVEKIGEKLGISKEESIEIVSFLVSKTFENIKKQGAEKSLSGPIARGDVTTIKEHINELKCEGVIQEYYKTVSKLLLEISNINEEKIKRINELLNG